MGRSQIECVSSMRLALACLAALSHSPIACSWATDKPELYWQVNGKLRPKVSFRYVPVRVCRPFKPFIQEPVLPKHPDGTDRSLGDVLHQLIPEVVVSPTGPVRAQVLVQGITPPLETPISWLAYNCSHPDNFLYICVLQPPPTAADRLV